MSRDVLIWWGGALLVALGIGIWLWWTAPEAHLLPETYGFGVL